MNWLYALSFVEIPRWLKWVPVSACAGFFLGAWIAYGVGHDAGHAIGVTVGEEAQKARQAAAVVREVIEAIDDREAGEDEAADEWNRAGGDLERLCEADPACRDRRGLYVGTGTWLVDPGHAGDGARGAGPERGAREAMPAAEGGIR